jgi:hypothetical protein
MFLNTFMVLNRRSAGRRNQCCVVARKGY